jgi:probable HAF family extracellular repeat protein
MKRTTLSVVWCLGLLFAASTCLAQQYTVTDLGTLGGTYSVAHHINNSGDVVGYSRLAGSAVFHAFLYSGGSMTDLGTLGGDGSQALGINNTGQVVGYSYITGNNPFSGAGIAHAFIYSGGVMTDLGTLGGTLSSSAYAINDAGQVVGTAEITGDTAIHAFLYSGIMMDLGTLDLGPGPYNDSLAQAINTDGQVAGYSYNGTITHAFLYKSGIMTDLGTLGGATSFAFGINNSGDVVGSSQTTGNAANLAFLYSGGVMTNLGTLGGTESEALGIGNGGQVVGEAFISGDTTHHAFLYENAVMKDINPAGWSNTWASGINDSGQVVGYGINPQGQEHGFILIPVTPYKAFVQPPINADGSSIFSASRGVIPVKFTLTQNGTQTCALPPATISLTRTAGGTLGSVNESTYAMQADSGSNFRIDLTACQYIYNLAASSLGVGTYQVGISINGIVVGNAVFALQ